jgi:gluconate 5-dehydrogenase
MAHASTPPDRSAATDPVASRPLSPAALFDLSGQVALVTGASRGLGWSIAQTLAAAGATVVLNGRDSATLEPRREALQGWGFPAEVASFDVADGRASAAAIEAIGARFGRLDILVSNAAATYRKPLPEQTEADWERVIQADLTAGWRLAREAARIMIPARYGRMIFTSSIMGSIARPTVTGYVAAKTGLHGLVRALAVELAPSDITVNALAPGYFLTEGNAAVRRENPAFEGWIAGRTPAGRWGKPPELVAAALYLASRAASYTTGSVLTVDGGMTAAI